MNRQIIIFGILLALSASVVWGGSTGKASRFEARKYFSGHCAGCHGVDGRGNPRVAGKLKVDLSEMDLQGTEAAGKTAKELSAIIMKGRGKMPAFGKSLTEGQAGEMAVYIRKMAPNKEGKPGLKKAKPDGASLFTVRSCTNCHGNDGKGSARVAKMLKADAAAMDLTGVEARGKTDAELAEIIINGAEHGKMPAYGAKMTRDEIDAVVAHIRGLK